ncbi:S8 family peptidase [Agarivorans sp. MS3-6]
MKTGIAVVVSLILFGCGGGGDSSVVDNRPVYSVSGSAIVLTNTVIDSDVNDVNSPYASNNQVTSAQELPPIAVVSGYLTSHATQVSGDRFATTSDYIDIYKVDLQAGQRLFLEIADWESGKTNSDFDLSLYKVSDESEVASSIGINKTELIDVETTDSYYIVVDAYTGGGQTLSRGNYTLRLIGQNQLITTHSQHFSTQQDFVIDEMVVNHSAVQARTMDANQYGLSRVSGSAKMSLYRNEQPLAAVAGSAKSALKGGVQSNEYAAKKRTLQTIKLLAYQMGIDSVSPNFLYQATALSNDALVERQWHYQQINLEAGWQAMQGQTLNDVVVAVLDTGMFQSHPDLNAQLTGDGIDFISYDSISLDGDGIDTNPEDPGDQSGPNGTSSWHGTHVAGTIAAQTNNNLGVAGVAPNAKIMNLRVLGYGGGTTYDISQAILYAAGLENASGLLPDKTASIINMSLGGSGYDSTFNQAVQDAVAQGLIVVAAAGNESTSSASYPAAFDNVIGVSAVDAQKQITSYSNYGSYIDIAAPGGNSSVDLDGDGYGDGVYSTYVNENGSSVSASYQYLNGTSMAAPHVAGVLALMKQLNPDLDSSEFFRLLTNGFLSDDLGAAGKDSLYGYGLINAEKAVQSQIGVNDPDRSYLSLSASQISLSALESEASFSMQLVGASPISIVDIAQEADWLELDASATDGNGLGTYSVVVDRAGLSDGNYSTSITLTGSDGSEHKVAISMTVVTEEAGDSGLVYALLIDPNTGNTIYSQQLLMNDGVFQFAFAEVAEADYRLYVSSDNDNDFVVCDEGELCGAYPVRNDINLIQVNQNISGLSLDIEPITTEDLSSLSQSLLLKVK